MKLTPELCRNPKPSKPDAKPPFKMTDGAGLYLYVAAGGGRLFRLDYVFNRKRKTLSLGQFPAVTLDDARDAAKRAREQIGAGTDPASEKQAAKKTAHLRARTTFAAVATEVIQRLRKEKKARTTIRKRLWIYRVLAKDLRPRPVADITASEILAVIRKVESRGKLESALRLRSAIGQVMRLAVATDRRAVDPTPALKGMIATPNVQHRAALTTPEEAGRLMLAIAGYDSPIIRAALLLSAYTFVRPGELRMAVWSEVDTRKSVWVIPAPRTKMKQAAHHVPLSPQALEQFKKLWRITGRNTDALCFPGLRDGRPISENTINMALRTLGITAEEHCAHGFRAMASTILNEHSDFSADGIEKALGHKEQNAVRGAYHRGQHMAERTRLMTWYADFLDEQASVIRRKRQDERFFG